eukprot:scaffold23456_cov89-Isochrysis_galbana.AAC.2
MQAGFSLLSPPQVHRQLDKGGRVAGCVKAVDPHATRCDGHHRHQRPPAGDESIQQRSFGRTRRAAIDPDTRLNIAAQTRDYGACKVVHHRPVVREQHQLARHRPARCLRQLGRVAQRRQPVQ